MSQAMYAPCRHEAILSLLLPAYVKAWREAMEEEAG